MDVRGWSDGSVFETCSALLEDLRFVLTPTSHGSHLPVITAPGAPTPTSALHWHLYTT